MISERTWRDYLLLAVDSIYRRLRSYARRVRYSTRIEDGLCGLASIDFRTVLDVGALDGRSAIKFLKLFPNAIIHSFEPQLSEFIKLQKLSSKEAKLRVWNVALSNSRESLLPIIRYEDEDPSTSSLLSPTERTGVIKVTEMVKVTTLDEWTTHHTLEEPILIKMDVQGYESSVILGGLKTFQRSKAIIAEVCFYPFYDKQSNWDEVRQLLSNFSYIGNLDQVADSRGSIKFIDACFLRGGSFDTDR